MKYFTISQFSKLTNTAITKLRYYDQMDILKPEVVKENKYRFYTFNQIQTIEWINLLKQCGLSIKEICELIKSKKVNVDLITEKYNELINYKKKEIQDLEYNLSRLNKKMNIRNESMKKDGIYYKDFIKGKMVVQEFKEKTENLFYLPEQLYSYVKKNNLVEKLSIIQKGLIYKNNKIYFFVELANDQDITKINENDIMEIEPGTHICMISKLNEIQNNINKMLKENNKTMNDVVHIVCDKLLDKEISKANNLFEIQILLK